MIVSCVFLLYIFSGEYQYFGFPLGHIYMPTLEKHVVVITVAVLHLEGVLLHGTVATAKIT